MAKITNHVEPANKNQHQWWDEFPLPQAAVWTHTYLVEQGHQEQETSSSNSEPARGFDWNSRFPKFSRWGNEIPGEFQEFQVFQES